MKLTIENLETCLGKIDYKIKGVLPNRFIYNHKNKNTGIRVWDEKLDFNMDCGLKAIAVMDKCTIKMFSKTTIMFGDGKLFIQLHNFNKNKKVER